MSAKVHHTRDERPNLVLLLTDSWRGDCLGVSGHPVVETPNLDALALRGTNFTAAYTTCPSCIAARASLFTGQRPTTHGRLGYQDQVPWHYDCMLSEELRAAGYQTACIGKTHFFPQGAHFGFEYLESYEGEQNFDGSFVNDYDEWLRHEYHATWDGWAQGLDSNSWIARPSHLPEEFHNNTWVVTRGLEYVRRRDRTRPFFINLSFHRPHAPLDPPTVYWDRFQQVPLPPVPVGDWAAPHDRPAAGVNPWHGRLPPRERDCARRAYFAQLAHLDNQIARFIFGLRKLRLGPTWYVFTSDHGEMLGDHCMWRKTYAYEGSARVPLIICPPEGAPTRVCTAPVMLEDLMPTLLAAGGADVPASVEGRSLLPFLTQDQRAVPWREYLHGEHSPCYEPTNACQYVTDGREKLVWNPVTGEEQFFNLVNDPQECHDASRNGAQQERVALWRARLIAELAPRTQDGLVRDGRLQAGVSLPATRAGTPPG